MLLPQPGYDEGTGRRIESNNSIPAYHADSF